MKPLFESENKRQVAVLLPYKFKSGSVEFFLQKRDQHAKKYPGFLGHFGGGLENKENSEDVLIREVQ